MKSDPPKTTIDLLLTGFPGRTPRGWLGWSTVTLICQAGRALLFDTGGPGDRPALLASLQTKGLTPGDIDTIVLSHFHFDHAGNVELFPTAEILVHETTAVYAQEQTGKDLALLEWVTTTILAQPRVRLLRGEPEVWPGIQMIQTPGHTSGCVSLRLEQEQEVWVFAADAVKHREELSAGVAQAGFDLKASRNSIARIRRIADRVIPGHDVPLRVTPHGIEPEGQAHLEIMTTLTASVAKMATLDL
ncbi:MAG: MBL fold metallo-hydrolase [Ardenticatenaceae bacterium]|nr:MBL fold metallo-hydrolase [Ardenticatenaceae bacterium]